MKNFKLNYLWIAYFGLFFTISACKKEDVEDTPPLIVAKLANVTTGDTSNVSSNSAVCSGTIIDDGGALITKSGICWGLNMKPTITDSLVLTTVLKGEFSVTLNNLTLGETYYYRTFAVNKVGVAYGIEKSFTTDSKLIPGALFGGGMVLYVDGTGMHGLIVTLEDQKDFTRWGCYKKLLTGCKGKLIGTGQKNTNEILAGCSDFGSAADICNKLVYGGFDDWYLPSEDEGMLFYTNLKSKGIGKWTLNNSYWCSTQVDSDFAKAVNLSTGSTSGGSGKDNWGLVRAIRSF